MFQRTLKLILTGAVGLVGLLIIALGAFPWGALKGALEKKTSEQVGQVVTIGSMKRQEPWSLTPTIILESVAARQAAWAGEGNLATVEKAAIRLPAIPLLWGDFQPTAIDISGMRLNLLRNEEGRKSWSAEPPSDAVNDKPSAKPTLRRLTVKNSRIIYADAKRKRRLGAEIRSDETGLHLSGEGAIREEPVTILVRAAPVVKSAYGKPWPFYAEIAGDAIGMTFKGEMEGPLDVGRLTAVAAAHGDDLMLIDAIIEAGLPETQPVTLTANVKRESPDWRVTDLKGTIGRSDIAGDATIERRNARTIITGALAADKFDFDDLSNAEGRRIAEQKRARYGPRVFPDTAIDLDNVDDTDGSLHIQVKELLWPGPSPFRSLEGSIKIDHQLLTVEDLTLGLTHGRMTGRITVNQREGATVLDLAFETNDARFADFFPSTKIDAPMAGHIRLTGPGRTVREAIGRSTGSLAIVAENGVIPANVAALLGQDVGKGVMVDSDKEATLNCLVARLDVKDGQASPSPIVIDTSRAVTHAEGSIAFADEALSLQLTGAPKKGALLRFDGAIPVNGVIKKPKVSLPGKADTVGEVLEMIGETIIDDQGEKAVPVNCEELIIAALR
ncbi:MAG: AsmA family protein [Amphiplicatus sp.]